MPNFSDYIRKYITVILAITIVFIVFSLALSLSTSNDYDIQEGFDFNANNSSEVHVREVPRRSDLNRSQWVPKDEANISNYRSDIVEVTRYPDRNVTEEDIENAYNLYTESFKSAKQNDWFDIEAALSDGYYNWMRDPTHYPNNEFIINNDENLNPSEPEFLYYQRPEDSNKPILTGVMYLKDENYEHGSQPGGPLTIWHRHQYDMDICQVDQVLQKSQIHNDCSFYSSERTAEMIHVWFIEHPDGQFATNMSFPKEYIEKEPEMMNRVEFEENQELINN